MDLGKANYENLHKYFSDILTDFKKGENLGIPPDEISKYTEDLRSVVNKILVLCKCSSICFLESTMFMSLLDILKLLCEPVIDITSGSVLKHFFTNIFRDVSAQFIISLIDCQISEYCVQYKIAEVLSYFISACSIVFCIPDYYQKLHIHLQESKTCSQLLCLGTIEKLCEFNENYSNLSFINFLFTNVEFYFKNFFPRCLIEGSRQEQIFALRIYHRCLVTSNDNRIILIQHLKYVADNQNIILCDPVLCEKYLQFFKALFPFPGELDYRTSAIGPIAEGMVSKLLASMYIIPDGNKYFGGVDIKSSNGHKTIVCGIAILFLKFACSIFELPFTTGRNILICDIWNCIVDLITVARDSQSEGRLSERLIGLFLEQDDDLINMMLLHLHFSCSYLKWIPNHNERNANPDDITPHQLFLTLMKHLSFDSSIMLDWLTSDETKFLQYFVKYLKFLASSSNDFLKACFEMDDLNKNKDSSYEEFKKYSIQSENCLNDLTQSIKRLEGAGLFPYSAKPLLRLLEACIQLFLALK